MPEFTLTLFRIQLSDTNRRRLNLIAAIMGLGLTLSLFAYSAKPYVYGTVIWALVFCYATAISARPWAKAAWLNLCVLVLTLGMVEIYFDRVYFSDEPLSKEEFSDNDSFFHEHDLLGFAPEKARTYSHTRWAGSEVIYRVNYTIDQHGLRLAPPLRSLPGHQATCLLFFGDSFTFGEGVKDEETMPYLIGLKSDGRHHIFNFAFLGYGPHQMLAQLQQRLVSAAIDCRPAYAIYLALPDHVSRSAGLEFWDQQGPRYVVDGDGGVVWTGTFDEDKGNGLLEAFRHFHRLNVPSLVAQQLERSALYKGLLYMHRAINDRDIDLFVRIVDTAQGTLEAEYPGLQFHVLFWDFKDGDPTEMKTIESLRAKHIAVHLISRILPDYRAHPERFWIHYADRHPNQLAYERLADYILTKVTMPAQ